MSSIRTLALVLLLTLVVPGAAAQDEGLPGGPQLSPRGRQLAQQAEAPRPVPVTRRVGLATGPDGVRRDVYLRATPDGEWELRVANPGQTPGEAFPGTDRLDDEHGTPREEARTVGLGDYADEPLTENAIRRDLTRLYPDYAFPPRAGYFHSLTDPDLSWDKVFRPPSKRTKPAPPVQAQGPRGPPRKGAAGCVDELLD